MKKTTISMLLAFMLMIVLTGCGKTETMPEPKDPAQTSQTEQETQTQQQPEKQQEETTKPNEDSQKTDDKEQPASQTNPEQKTEETTQQKPEENQEEKLYSEGEFDGHYFKCKLPDKWIAKEDATQGYATIMLDPTQNAGLSVQVVENNNDSAQARAQGIADQFQAKVEDVKIGNYSYKRITTSVKDEKTQKSVVMDYLVCVVGTKAYYLGTPIFDQAKTQELLSNIQFK